MYGTVLFEAAYKKDEKPDFLEIVINQCDKPFSEKVILFKQFEKEFSNIDENIIDEFLVQLVNSNGKQIQKLEINEMQTQNSNEFQNLQFDNKQIKENQNLRSSRRVKSINYQQIEQMNSEIYSDVKLAKQIKNKKKINSEIKNLSYQNSKNNSRKVKQKKIKNFKKCSKISLESKQNEQQVRLQEENQILNISLDSSFKIKKKVKTND
eukprot:TRINITY_DN1649_c0_g1_i10.p2 TRINITY_DN1649_c0_g1~~TRINITY_DN1649_c0_g1_i10.p2  ORF type:complete len:209 (-),score=54.94 TRINITY_DN1649_c0_g1_i10:223-849(-)